MTGLGVDEQINLTTAFIKRLDGEENVSKRELRKVLTDKELLDIEDSWQSRSDFKKEYTTRPSELNRYVEYLSKADRLTNLSTNFAYKLRGVIDKRSAVKKMLNKVDGAYERALECLQETLEQFPGMASHLDRPVSFEPGQEPGIYAGGMPRWGGSRSHLAQGWMMSFGTKRDVKREALERKLSELRGDNEQKVVPEGTETPMERLARLKRKGLM